MTKLAVSVISLNQMIKPNPDRDRADALKAWKDVDFADLSTKLIDGLIVALTGRGLGPKQSLLVLMTDYTNYAVTYSCLRRTFGHKQNLSILSRKRHLSDLYLNKIYGYINRLGLTRSQLQAINQEECQEPELNENGFALNKPWYYFFNKYANQESPDFDSSDDKYW